MLIEEESVFRVRPFLAFQILLETFAIVACTTSDIANEGFLRWCDFGEPTLFDGRLTRGWRRRARARLATTVRPWTPVAFAVAPVW